MQSNMDGAKDLRPDPEFTRKRPEHDRHGRGTGADGGAGQPVDCAGGEQGSQRWVGVKI